MTDQTQRPDWLALSCAVATAAISLVLLAGGPTGIFIAAACLFWTAFIWIRARRDKGILREWGFRTDNLLSASAIPAFIFVVSLICFATYGSQYHPLRSPIHAILLLPVYSAWGVIQQFLVLAVFVGNLERVPWLRQRRALVTLLGAALFGFVHVYDPRMIPGTFLLELLVIPLYLWQRNLWPLGLLHGWLGAFFYLWVLNRDLWSEYIGRYLMGG